MGDDQEGISSGCLKRVLLVLLPVVVLMTIPSFVIRSCSRTVTDTSYLKPSTGPWTVNRIVPGMTQDDCRRILGEPWRILTSTYAETTWQWQQPDDVTISFDTNSPATVCEVLGRTLLDFASNTVIWGSADEEEVKIVLKGAKVRKHYRPKGSGVISIGREHVGTTYTVSLSNCTYTVNYYEGRMSGIRATR